MTKYETIPLIDKEKGFTVGELIEALKLCDPTKRVQVAIYQVFRPLKQISDLTGEKFVILENL